MNKLALSLLVIATLAGAPRAADAQVYPERIRTDARNHRADAYQRRNNDAREEQVERYTKTVKLGATGELDVANVSGDITVTRGSGSDATVEVIKTARARSADEAKSQLQLVQVDIAERAGRVEIRARYPSGEGMVSNRRNVNVSVSYNITAPGNTRLTAKSVSGNIKVTDIKGDVSAESVSGNVQIGGSGRVGLAKSVSGNVEIADTQIDGTLEAGSISGDVVMRKVAARRIDTSTISGTVRMEDMQCDRIDAQSISGPVAFSGALARGGRYALKSHSGEVTVTISGGTGFEVDASSFSGQVRSDLPITTRGMDTRRQRTLSGTYGDGSAILELTSFSGNVVIAKR
ncbi:MAG TPA: DUF4097 family beta strand repeat-containing protein [Vicinamibacterales bacterium]|jgi:DUF4097 and DUF4098 domain-containing protein YvlB